MGLLLAAVMLVLAACGQDPPAKDSAVDYTPVPDQELFSRLAQLPGVAAVEVEYVDTFANPNRYTGSISVSQGADARRVLDAAIALMRTGRPKADVAIRAKRLDGGLTIGPDSLGLFTPSDVEERYGPQPGDGTPPATLP